MAQARTGAACGGMLCGVTLLFRWRDQSDASSGAGVNVAFLVQADGHAAAKPGGNAGRSRHVKGAGSQQGMGQPGKSGKESFAASEGRCGKAMTMKPSCIYVLRLKRFRVPVLRRSYR
ncbi:hypothetical protein N6N72_17175 [Escherichia albertii]|uniref:hypothetical protein n=1 Tax=Escherichia albertii TaxID=208962 RepID=UPI001CB9A4DC|nr:hypothetical protein [Escherichia albertii]MCU7328573.1 hypothetical protein [Escherichia albertii]MCU7345946.1 hypothetical protein [Escherichia albertii]